MNNKYSAGQKPTFTRKISPKMGLLGFSVFTMRGRCPVR